MRSFRLFAAVTAVAACGCGGSSGGHPVTLSVAGARVELSQVPREDCRRLGDVQGIARARGSPEAAMQWARNEIRNEAAALGANFVLLEMGGGGSSGGRGSVVPVGGGAGFVRVVSDNSYSLYGTAFLCPDEEP